MTIKIDTKDELNEFIDICCKYKFDIDACYGRYTVDARSLLGLLSIGLGKPMKIVAYYDSEKYAKKLAQELERWVVND